MERDSTGLESKNFRKMMRFMLSIFGAIGHVQIFSHELEQRIRTRYQSEIDQLAGLGFDYLFSDGETFPVFRLLLLFPAFFLISMRIKREVMTIHDGTMVLVGHPVCISKNRNAFAEPNGLETKFYTAFQDGAILISMDCGDEIDRGSMILINNCKASILINNCKASSISDTWAKHQKRIAELEAEGRRVDCQTSFQAYVEIEHKERAAW